MNKISILLVTLLAFCWLSGTGIAQDDTYPNPTPRFLTLTPHPQILVPATNLPQWNGSFKDLTGTMRNFTMVGPSPLKNNGTTTIPVFLIPIKMVYGKENGNMTFDPNKAKFQGTNRSVTKTILASPIFQSEIDFKQGGTDLGKTQYIDAFQRGTFWGEVKKHNKYHVLLARPRILPEQTIHVSTTEGHVGTEYGKTVGFMDSIAFTSILYTYFSKFLQIQPNTLPIFLTYDVYVTSGGCCVGGLHSSNGGQPGGQTFVWSTTIDQGTGVFSQDTATLSHEIGEWMDDPFVDNQVGCANGTGILEVGDPLVLHDYPYTVNGFNYHLQDLVFLPYFGAPRTTSLHGWYSFQKNDEKNVCPGQP